MQKQAKSSKKCSGHAMEMQLSKLQKTVQLHERDLTVEELFFLPKTVLKPPVPLRGSIDFHKKFKSHILKEKEPQAHQMSYAAMRKEREDFRKRLIALIFKQDQEETSSFQIPTPKEKESLRYYYYIQNGIDTINVAPLDHSWINNICAQIPEKVQTYNILKKQLIDEVKEEFVFNMKKAIVDFVLLDPSESSNWIKQYDSVYRKELKEISKTWKPSFEKNLSKIQTNLHRVNPCLAQVLDLWYKSFSEMRLVNVKDLSRAGVALELTEFQALVSKHIDAAKECLKTQWFPKVQDIFLLGNRKKLVPSPDNTKKMKQFYDCVATIMTYQLQSLCLNSISDFTNFICGVGFANSGFVVSIAQRNKILVFEPTFNSYNNTLLDIYNMMIAAVRNLPRLETKLYMDWEGPQMVLKPIIPDDIVECDKERVSSTLEDQRIGPELRVQDFDDYMNLINHEACFQWTFSRNLRDLTASP